MIARSLLCLLLTAGCSRSAPPADAPPAASSAAPVTALPSGATIMLLAADIKQRYALQKRLEGGGYKVVHANRVYGYTHGLAALRMAPPDGEVTFPDVFEGEPSKVLQAGRAKCGKVPDEGGRRARCSKALGEAVWQAFLRHRGAVAELDLRVPTRRVKNAMLLTLRRAGEPDQGNQSLAGVEASPAAAVELLERLLAAQDKP